MKPATVVITMAGMGQRFRDAGYELPKYRIEVHGKTLFAWSMESLGSFIAQGSPFVFIVRRADGAESFIRAEAKKIGIKSVELIELGALTDGQATSALLAGPAIKDPAAPMLVYNIDTYVDPAFLPADAARGDGWVPCFPGAGAAWSFARAEADGRIVELREKARISDDASVGLYWFSSFNLYRDMYRTFFAKPASLVKGERYIAPLYNELIEAGYSVYIHRLPLESVIALGTPAEVERFAAETVRVKV